jgi:DHA3 family macrolide efflux protein-like MFS transporter
MSTYEAPANGWLTFLIVWVTQSISVFGSALTFFAITIWLTQVLYPLPEQKPQLALAISLTSLAFALPTVFGAPIAGAWVDRHNRKLTMMSMDALSGILSIVIVVLIVSDALQLWMLLLLMLVAASIGVFHGAAFDTSYAMIVPEKQLPRANGMMQTIWSLSGILSPAIAATIISLPALARQGLLPGLLANPLAQLQSGTALCVTIDAVTFFLAAATLVFLYIPSPTRTDLLHADGVTKKSFRSDVKDGALFIWHRRPMLWLLLTFAVANFASSPTEVFLPLIDKFNLAADWTARGFTFESSFAFLSSIAGVGGVLGGVLISAWGGLRRKRVYGVIVPMIVGAVGQIALGLSGMLYVGAASLCAATAMIPIMNAHSQTIWQTQTPRELQGRVFSVRRVIAQFTWPLSTVLAGVLGGLFNPGYVVAALGSILLVFCVAQLFNPYLLRVEDKDYLDALAAQAMAKGAEPAS